MPPKCCGAVITHRSMNLVFDGNSIGAMKCSRAQRSRTFFSIGVPVRPHTYVAFSRTAQQARVCTAVGSLIL